MSSVSQNRSDALELSGQQFEFVDSRPFDKKYRVNLGKKVFALLDGLGDFESFKVYMSNEGYILLAPMAHIPVNEMWIWQDPEIRESFQRAFNDIREGRIKRGDDLDTILSSD